MTKLLKQLKYNEVVKRLKKFNFRFFRQGKGSHELWVRDTDGKVIPVPHHSKPIKTGTLRSIIRDICVSVEEFME